ncbi:hypothetical protein DFP72DRAFT_879606 [Ephemerocybe angulata]|uniref:Uncharacterized protein n=1 Tax=Ephemerocybe angulata TaxID=980116 RepID=A0A8H6IAX8_9AGAR|nr:hypothetical protein DFP72DRAFT_879606 [Tulosesus angulatus]
MADSPSNHLPNEVWARILEFIPKGEEGQLYSVNQALLHLVLSRRYEEVVLEHATQPRTQRALHALRTPMISSNVKSIVFWLDTLRKYVEPPRKQTHWDRLWRRPIPPIQPDASTLALAQAFPSDLSECLPLLQALTISYNRLFRFSEARHYATFRDAFKPYIINAMASVAGRLSRVYLQLPLEIYRDGVLGKDIHFPQLEELCLTLSTIYKTTDFEDALEQFVAPFVNRQRDSIKIMSFRFGNRYTRHTEEYFRVGRLFQALVDFPGLSDFTIELKINQDERTGLDQLSTFIQRHRGSLRTLGLFLLDPEQYRCPISRVHTPNTLCQNALFNRTVLSCNGLTRLTLALLSEESFLANSHMLLTSVSRSSWTGGIIHLKLDHSRLKQGDIIDLISKTEFPSLRSIAVNVEILTMVLFDLFVVRLPLLQTLHVTAGSVQARNGHHLPETKVLQTSPFLADLEACSYPQWSTLAELSFNLIVKGVVMPTPGCWMGGPDPPQWVTKTQLQPVFPTVQNFAVHAYEKDIWY